MFDPNPNQNNNDELIDIYEGEEMIIYYDEDGEQHIEWKDE